MVLIASMGQVTGMTLLDLGPARLWGPFFEMIELRSSSFTKQKQTNIRQKPTDFNRATGDSSKSALVLHKTATNKYQQIQLLNSKIQTIGKRIKAPVSLTW
jgi:hypothetical protein